MILILATLTILGIAILLPCVVGRWDPHRECIWEREE